MLKRNRKDGSQRLVDEAAASLLANIRFMSVDTPIKTIEITSSIPNEGKSFVSINLAQAIAKSGKTCLIMEGDLRKRSLASAMGLHPRHGLYSVLSDSVPFDQAVYATSQKNLYFLDAEPQIPNPPDLFGSKRFAAFIEQVSEQFDYVIIDTAPVGTFVDAAVVSMYMDAVFMVVRENFTKKNMIASAYDQLAQAGAHVAGVIMNDCGADDESYYDYYNYYNDYGSEKDLRGDGATGNAFNPSTPAASYDNHTVANASANTAAPVKKVQTRTSVKPANKGKAATRSKNAKANGNPMPRTSSVPNAANGDASKYSRENYAHRR